MCCLCPEGAWLRADHGSVIQVPRLSTHHSVYLGLLAVAHIPFAPSQQWGILRRKLRSKHTTPFMKHNIIQGHEPEYRGPLWDLNTGPLTSVGCTHSTLISRVNNLPISVDGLPLGSQLIPSTVHSFNQHSLSTDQSPDTSELGKQRQSPSQ